MVLLEPPAPERAVYALLAGGVAMGGLLAAGRLSGNGRQAAAVGVSLVAFGLALVGGGVADELLRPDRWGTLASGISRGVESLPGVRVPYRGVDEWARTVIPLGGTVLVTAAAIAAFWPRRNRVGFPGLALTLLVALYAVPAVSLDFENEFLRGAVLALLVLAFLRLEKLRVGDASNAGLVAAAVAVVALMLAPALDRDTPWWDYESWALGAASARTTSFTWDHDYGPLDWPRDGRELLRVRAEKRPAYWKAANLDSFDGRRWIQDDPFEDPGMPESEEAIEQGTQDIKVTIRNLESRVFITAGYASFLDSPTIRERERGDGTWIASRDLRRGDAYTASVYSPSTNESQRRRVGNEFDRPDLAPYRALILPASGDRFQSGAPQFQVLFPAFGFEPEIYRGVAGRDGIQLSRREILATLEQGPYRRTWELAQELRAEAETQEDLVQSVLTHLRRGYAYTETPKPEAYNLDGFLWDSKAGYCQQFSGAMALLLRMAGVPARVVTGFTTGSLDSKTKEYVVRDLDAHSWVEVWYRDIGWVTFDPTPAAAPARSQPDDGGTTSGPGASVGPPSLGGDLPSDPGRRAAAPEEGTSWAQMALILLAITGLPALAVLLWRRRRRRSGTPHATMAIAELERALRRARLHPGPGTTLRSLEERFARSPAAAGYVRAVRDLRYGGRPAAPTLAQRRGLRAELARGMGLTGRLRAWWALPPRAH
jgi:transglutaminase-like putative cysteine protease